MEKPEPKAGRNQFKCFQCRKIFATKDGEWRDWNEMQVHLCFGCDKQTLDKPERNRRAR
jgi:hypothetical protein